jgi:hypothetical protein
MSQPGKTQRALLIGLLFPLVIFLFSCGTPAGPAKGSPEWYYTAAKEEFRSGGILKAEESLEKLEGMEGPYRARAVAWDLLVKSGRLLGYEELAEAYTSGWPRTRTNKTDFAREKSLQLKEIQGYSLHFLEALNVFDKAVTGPTVALEFPFPAGSGAPVPDLERLEKGIWPPDEQRSALVEKIMQRGLIRGISAGISGPDDVAGAQKVMQSGSTSVPMERFVLALADTTSRCATFYDDHHLSDSSRRKMFLERTVDLAKRISEKQPDNKDAKKLLDDAQKALKKK